MSQKLLIGNSSPSETLVKTPHDLGEIIKAARKLQGISQKEIAGLGNTGNRVIVDIENGKPTVQLKKVLDLMDLLGLQLVVRNKGEK